MVSNKIRLFWWNEVKLMKKEKENYGDLLGKYLVEKISGRKAVWIHPKKKYFKNLLNRPIYVTVGSILAQINEKCIVWGSGIISKDFPVKNANFLAVRGPKTRAFLIESGYQVPEVYGDPALLLPDYYHPKIDNKFSLGIVPHYKDYQTIKELYTTQKDVLIIDLMTNDIEETTNLFLQCEKIISSSLHGLIVPHAYNIPAVWVPFSNKLFGDGIKFQDYFESVGISNYTPEIFEKQLLDSDIQNMFDKYPSLPKQVKIESLKKDLMSVCPFKLN